MSSRYCIIGAGAAGIGALKTLLDQGFDVDCYEKSDRVGGHWHTDYEALHLITPKNSSGFDGFPMPEHYPLYPSREQACAYLVSYAEHFDLYQHIRFSTTVENIIPLGEKGKEGWTVQLKNGEKHQYTGVLVANGHLWDPRIPEEAKLFTGTSIHSGQYRNTNDIEGRVLVVGFGNSGCDLAVDAAQARKDVSIVMRRGQVFQPKALFGRPRAELTFVNAMPPDQQNAVLNSLIQVSLGDYTQYPEMPAPDTYNLDDQPPVVNTLLLYWIQHGRIRIKPSIKHIEGKDVTFIDGHQEHFDTILWSTGFNVTLPFIDSHLLEWKDGVPLRTAACTLPTTVENLYFIGLCAPRGPQWPVYTAQTRLVAQMLHLRESGIQGLTHYFSQLQPAETRIDIVRRYWQSDHDQTISSLSSIETAKCLPANESIFKEQKEVRV